MSIYTTPENENLDSFECYPEKSRDKIALYSWDTFQSDNFIPPSKFYYRNAFGDAVFFLKRNRGECNSLLSEIEGEGKYNLRTIIKVSVC